MDLFKDQNKKKQLIFTYGAFAMNGMLALSIGSLLPFIRDAKGLDYAFAGMIVSLHSVGNLISSFVAGALPLKLGRKKSILVLNSFFALSYLVIILFDNSLLIALSFLLTGVARGATSNFGNTSINELAPGKASLLNGLHAMFAIGAFTFPLLLLGLTNVNPNNWIYACWFLLFMGILSWVMYFCVPLENDKPGSGKKGGESGFGFFKEPLFYLCTLTLFFYLCAEQGVIGWMITYFKDTGLLPASYSQVTASLQWIMILVGRLLVAWASTKVHKEKLLVAMGFGLVGFFLLLLLGGSTPLILFGIMGFGFSMAGIYPTVVSFAGRIIQKYSLAWSFMLTSASIGSILMPSIIGRIAETAGITSGMRSVVFVVVLDLCLILILTTYIKRLRKRGEAV